LTAGTDAVTTLLAQFAHVELHPSTDPRGSDAEAQGGWLSVSLESLNIDGEEGSFLLCAIS
jgi:hypothetical protein